jgi:hypothetical protein
MADHYVVIKGENGEAIQYPLKPWARKNLHEMPKGIDPDSQTSHDVRRRLKQNGWRLDITGTKVFVIRPDENGSFDYANNFISGIIDEVTDETTEGEEALEMTFGLEKDMQAALRKNIESLEKGLTVIDGGKERITEAGRIDITAKDSMNRTVIIELKAIDAKPEVIAQTLAYMETVKKEDKVDVRGIIIASGFPERVKLAARQIPNLQLTNYSFKFNYNNVD